MQKLTFTTKIGNQMQNLYCRNVRNVKFPKIVAEKFAFYRWFCNININYYYSLLNKKTLDDFIYEFSLRGPLHNCVVAHNLFDGERKTYVMMLSQQDHFIPKYFGKSEGLTYRDYRQALHAWEAYLKAKPLR